ncbi:LOW QUALITY PROTEIN: hypothetical protein HJFPF1_07259 [Paramyrothecium foliicola]|nr:LOW QUALITY PROTEIN: hypothetical protein HJFPF1_07259 [Paramyrothecium foliicola]
MTWYVRDVLSEFGLYGIPRFSLLSHIQTTRLSRKNANNGVSPSMELHVRCFVVSFPEALASALVEEIR